MKTESIIKYARKIIEQDEEEKRLYEEGVEIVRGADYDPGVEAMKLIDARETIEFYEKAFDTLSEDDYKRLAAIPEYRINDVRDLKDIKDRLGCSWNDVRALVQYAKQRLDVNE